MKKAIFKAAAAVGLCLLAANAALAQTWPTRPIRLLVGYPPGGGSDVSARVTAQAMEKTLGQSIVVENRPGAVSLLAAQYVAKSDPDGYTIHFGNVTGFNPVFLKEGIDAAKVLEPITNLQVGGLIFATKGNAPYSNLQELVAWSKANPGKLNFASVAPSADLYMGVFKSRVGLDYVSVPYKGDAPIIQALLAGEADVALSNTLAVWPQVQAGKLKALWVSRSTRSSIAPNLPTLAELGVQGVVWEFYLGLWGPKGMPAIAIQRVNAAGVAAVKQPDIIEQYKKFGADSMGTTPEETMRAYVNEMKFWVEAAKLANYQPQ